MAGQQKQALLDGTYAPHKNFKESPLYIPGCTAIAFGEEGSNALLMPVGKVPGKNKDLQARPPC